MSLLYDRYAAAAVATATRILGDRAEGEDVVQEVFVRIWERADGYDTARGSAAAWILGSVRNGSIDRLRRREARNRAVESAAVERPPEQAPREFPEDLRRVTAAVAALPQDQRTPIELAYFDGLSQSEIALKLAQPLGTVKTRMRLAMQKLREALRGLAEEGR